jgi:sarcosine oxidase subunit beta
MSHPKCILCRCEDVTLEEFREAYREGFTEFESLKRYTGVGTGICQGKGCLCESAEELARLRKQPPREVRPTNIRPPAEPLTFAELASLSLPDFIQDTPAPIQMLDGTPQTTAREAGEDPAPQSTALGGEDRPERRAGDTPLSDKNGGAERASGGEAAP